MKHLGLYALSLAMFGLAGYLLYADVAIAVASHQRIPTMDLGFVLVCALLGFLLAGGADARSALAALGGFIPSLRGLREGPP